MSDLRQARTLTVLSLTTLLSLGARSAAAQAAPPTTGLMIVAHGAGAEWNASVRTTAAMVRWNGPVEVAFLMGPEAQSAGWDTALARLTRAGVRNLVLVPLMVSSFGGHYEQLRYYAGLRDAVPAELASHSHNGSRPAMPVALTGALDGAPEMAQAVASRWADLGEADCRRAVMLVGHGPSADADVARWLEQFGRVAVVLGAHGSIPAIRSALLKDDAAAEVRAAAVAAMRDTIAELARRTGDSVVVLPLLIARSGLIQTTIPTDLRGLPVRYGTTALTPHPAIARWIERVAGEALPVATQARSFPAQPQAGQHH